MIKVLFALFLSVTTATAQQTIGGSGTPLGGNVTAAASTSGGAAPAVTFNAVPNISTSGASVTLSWNVTGSTSQMIDQGIGSVTAVGSANVNPTVTTTYTLIAVGPGGTRGQPVTVTITPQPAVTLTASSNTPTQGSTITLSYTVTNATSCDISNGILANTAPCPSSPTSAFTPPFVAPGPTATTYTFCGRNANGFTCASQTVTVSAVVITGDDSRYCTLLGVATFPGGVTTDGPADLFQICNNTLLTNTPSPGSIHTVGYSGGIATCGTANADWDTAMSTVACGDTIKLAQGCAKTNCGNSTGCILPAKTCDTSHWILVESVDPATGVPDVGFPAEGQRATPCDIGIASSSWLPGFPDYSSDCLARGGPKNRMFKFTSNSATTPALAVYDSNPATPACSMTNYPCTQGWRFQGIEATTNPGTRTSHKLIEFAGGNNMILDRSVIHCQDDPLFRVECNGGVNLNGSGLSVINSYIGPFFCANAPSGSTCIDSQGMAGGTGVFPQSSHKIVNNFIASAGESWFWGGGQGGYYPTAGNPGGVPTDIEVRRNFAFHPLTWFLSYQSPALILTSVNTTGVYTGTIVGGTNNALVGRSFKVTGFVNVANNIPISLVTASTSSTISFTATTVAETHAGTATNVQPHWDPKNLGETKATNRSLWEANVCYNSWTGFQSDQFGNCFLATPKNQGKKLPIPSGDVVSGSTSGGLFYLNCTTTGGVACSTVSGHGLFTCELDFNAVPDWTGAGTTVASCGGIVSFGCAAGTQLGCPGSYEKFCKTPDGVSQCAVILGSIYTGPFYHILAVISPDQVQVTENSTSVVNAVPVIFQRGLSPEATVTNFTIRNNYICHTANGMEVSSGADDGGSEALGVHKGSIHDNVGCGDNTPQFWDNIGNCCNEGWFIKIVSSTKVPTTVPSNLLFQHNTFANIGYNSSKASGLLNAFDINCKPPFTAGNCLSGLPPSYFPSFSMKDNIGSSSLNLTGNAASFTPNTLANVLGIYGCNPAASGTCTWDVQKNLALTGVWSGQSAPQLDNLHLLGSNTVEACSCTTVANGGTCTPGSPNTWSAPVNSGSLDACDRTTGYSTIFNVYDPTGYASDFQLPSNSPYRGVASDGGNLGANVSQTLTMIAGVATNTVFPPIVIDGYYGNFTCTNAAACVLPAATHAVYYTITLHATIGASPYRRWTLTSGVLPAGVTLLLGTGALTGTPTTAGTYPFTMQVEDAGHQITTQAYSLVVN